MNLMKKIKKVFEDKELAILNRNDLNEIKNHLNDDALFKLYVHIQNVLKAEKWKNIKVEEYGDVEQVYKMLLTTLDNVEYVFHFGSAKVKRPYIQNKTTDFSIYLTGHNEFFRKYATKIQKEIQNKELERFV